MSVLVEAQGEMLDNIETQVSKSVDYVQRGNVALVAARRYQKLAEVDVLLHHHRAAHRVRHLVAGTATLDAGLRVGTHGMKSMISTAAFVVTKRLLSGTRGFLSFLLYVVYEYTSLHATAKHPRGSQRHEIRGGVR